jgi:pimeloyl-ACP methyl ester carboxylesterase
MQGLVEGVSVAAMQRGKLIFRARSALALILSVVVAAVTACSSDPEKYEYYRVTIDGQQTLGISAKGMMIRGTVIFFHGVNSNEFAMMTGKTRADFTSELVNAGFVVVSSNAGGDAFGNRESQKNYVYVGGTAAEHYQTEYVYFVAESMGAIAAADLVAAGLTTRVRAFIAINPILDLTKIAPQYQPLVDKSFAGQSIDAANPMNQPLEAFRGKKIRFYVSADDPLVPAETNALAFQARYGSVADISVVKCAGQADSSSCFQGHDVVQWLSQQEKRS